MRLVQILVLVVVGLLAACEAPGNSAGPAFSVAGQESQAAAPSSAASIAASVPVIGQEPVTVTGSGIEKSAPFHLEAGTYEVTWTATPPNDQGCYHGANLGAVDPDQVIFEPLANELLDSSAAKTGSTFIYNLDAGDYYVDASSGCEWSFIFTQQ
jgi:hypothetical protein